MIGNAVSGCVLVIQHYNLLLLLMSGQRVQTLKIITGQRLVSVYSCELVIAEQCSRSVCVGLFRFRLAGLIPVKYCKPQKTTSSALTNDIILLVKVGAPGCLDWIQLEQQA